MMLAIALIWFGLMVMMHVSGFFAGVLKALLALDLTEVWAHVVFAIQAIWVAVKAAPADELFTAISALYCAWLIVAAISKKLESWKYKRGFGPRQLAAPSPLDILREEMRRNNK